MLTRCCAAILLSWAALTATAQSETVLRVAPPVDLSQLDPVATNAAVTKTHGYLVYDELFAMDARGAPQPEMVDRYTVSPDRLHYIFTLRGGLAWPDGSPVTAADVVPSIRRWAARSPGGQILLARATDIRALDGQSFAIDLKQPDSDLIAALADPVTPLFVMRAQEAATDPFQSIATVVGSGPFVFDAKAYRPGSRAEYTHNPAYRPRPEPANGMAGGKSPNIDRIVWQVMPDPNTAIAALNAGEVDLVENPSFDLLPILAKNPDVVVRTKDNMGYMAILRPNHLAPPFDNPKARQASAALIDQQDYLQAMVGRPDYERPCADPFGCGRATEAAPAPPVPADLDRAKQLFAEAGYHGEPIVVLDPSDLEIIHAMTQVTVQQLRKAGVTVDQQTTDWATLLKRRLVKDPPSKNPAGWHLVHFTVPVEALQDPASHPFLDSSCAQANQFGWPCDPEIERLRLAYVDAATPEDQAAVKNSLRQRFAQSLPFLVVGQYYRAVAYRKSVHGLIDGPYMVYWGATVQ